MVSLVNDELERILNESVMAQLTDIPICMKRPGKIMKNPAMTDNV
jgi:hypothetical protein